MNSITLFEFIPFELLESILPYLNKDDLLSFLAFYDIKGRMNWDVIYFLHFDKIKNNMNYNGYLHWLSLEKLKEELINLKKLDLFNRLTEIPEEIDSLNNLQILDLNANGLTFLPKEIGNLTNLQKLNLSFNKLTFLPKEIGNLINLKELSLSFNNLTYLPKEIGNLINLQYLNLVSNGLPNLEKENIKTLLPNTEIYF